LGETNEECGKERVREKIDAHMKDAGKVF